MANIEKLVEEQSNKIGITFQPFRKYTPIGERKYTPLEKQSYYVNSRRLEFMLDFFRPGQTWSFIYKNEH